MTIKVFPRTFHGDLTMIGSKSLSHRYLIGAALANQPSRLNNLMISEDTTATLDSLKAMGAIVKGENIQGPLQVNKALTLHMHASGSSLRFLIPQALRFNQPVTFTGKDRLPERSLAAYAALANSEGWTFDSPAGKKWLPLKVQGPLKAGGFSIDDQISSQFVTGLLMALPLLDGDSKIILTKKAVSKPYIDMTLDVLKDFGIIVHIEDDGFKIPGNQTYHPVNTTIEGDYSHSIFFIAGALLGGNLTLHGLPIKSLQGDIAGLEVIQSMGGDLTHKAGTVTVKQSSLKEASIDLTDTPDLAPMLMALSAFSEGATTFNHVDRLKHKESDRLSVMKHTLNQMGVDSEIDANTLTVHGGHKSFQSHTPFETFNDHRIAMTLAMLAPKAKAPYIIRNVECTLKSYPDFLQDYEAIGGTYIQVGETL